MIADDRNIAVRVNKAFYHLTANLEELPVCLEITVQIENWNARLTLPVHQYNAKGIQAHFPLLRFRNRRAQAAFDDTLTVDLINGLDDGSIQRGYYFERAGVNTLPDGRICFICGSELLGSCGRTYMTAPTINTIHLLGQGASLSQLFSTLVWSPKQVLPVLAYVLLTSIRSLLTGSGIDLQAVLYIVGKQGLGKTTLATRIAGIYEKNGVPVGIVQAGSTHAAVNALMVNLRDQPIVIDDLCLSAGRDTARKCVELASKLIRQGTGSIPIIKRAGGDTVELPCGAGLIMTAEFHLENLSDLTRCIIVPVNEPLDIPSELNAHLVGAAVRHYLTWFIDHVHEEVESFRNAVHHAAANCGTDIRLATNYACLITAFYSFLRSFNQIESPDVWASQLLSMMRQALADAQAQHQAMIGQLKDSFPAGNLSFVILEGYHEGAFNLTKVLEKLYKHDGILWKDDLCLRKEALIQFVRQQPGYHDWTSHRITRALKDIGAFVLQEENATTVRLSKKPDIPRVYRIRMKVLAETAEKY